MPAIPIILSYIFAALKAAPDIAKAIVDAKNFISGLVGAGMIPISVQNTLHARVDTLAEHVLAGEEPDPSLLVEPDPVDPIDPAHVITVPNS